MRLERQGALDEPASEMSDVVAEGPRPAGGERPRLIGYGAHRDLERRQDRRRLRLEARTSARELAPGRLRVAPERVVLHLTPAKRVSPGLEDVEMVERMAVQDEIHPAPG